MKGSQIVALLLAGFGLYLVFRKNAQGATFTPSAGAPQFDWTSVSPELPPSAFPSTGPLGYQPPRYTAPALIGPPTGVSVGS